MFDNIKNEDKKRYFAIGIIALFMLSTIAIYISSSTRAGGSTSAPAKPTAVNETYSFSGRGQANATLTSWDPALFVRGPDSGLGPMLQELRQQGVVVNDVPQAGGHILTLASSELVYNTSRLLGGLNVTVLGSGTISIPQAYVQGAGASRLVSGGTYPYQDTPDFEQGEVFPVAFDAYVEGQGMPYTPQNIIVLPGAPADAEVKPLAVSISSTYLDATLPWAQRNLDLGQFQSDLIGGDKVRAKLRSVVLFRTLLTERQIAQVKSMAFNWSTGDVEEGLMGVKPEFGDQRQVEGDLLGLGIEPVFPVSDVWVYPWAGNRSLEKQLEDTQRIWNQSYPNLTARFEHAYVLSVTLPGQIMGSDGQAYRLMQKTYNVSSTYPPLENGTLKISFQPRGRQVDRLTSAFYSPPGVIEPLQAG